MIVGSCFGLLYFNKEKKAYEMTSLSVHLCLPLITFERIGNFYKIRHGSHAIGDDLDSIIFNPIASTILKWLRFRLLRWMQNLCLSVLDY
jgi:hypothetical protein